MTVLKFGLTGEEGFPKLVNKKGDIAFATSGNIGVVAICDRLRRLVRLWGKSENLYHIC